MVINILHKRNINPNSNIFNFPFILSIVCLKDYYLRLECNNIVSSGKKILLSLILKTVAFFLAHHNYLIHGGDMILILALFFRPIKKKIKKYGSWLLLGAFFLFTFYLLFLCFCQREKKMLWKLQYSVRNPSIPQKGDREREHQKVTHQASPSVSSRQRL